MNRAKEILQMKTSYALLGATRDMLKYSYELLFTMSDAGYTVYPINPKYENIEDLTCYPGLHALPEKLSAMLKGYNKLVRMIPTAASFMNSGYNPVWFSKYIGETEKNQLKELFAAFGDSPEVDEKKLEAYAIITAMGPTYLWPQLNELHTLALEFGLTEQETVAGMKAMLVNTMELLLMPICRTRRLSI